MIEIKKTMNRKRDIQRKMNNYIEDGTIDYDRNKTDDNKITYKGNRKENAEIRELELEYRNIKERIKALKSRSTINLYNKYLKDYKKRSKNFI